MEDFIYYSSLYDYYGALLTSTEQEYFKEYFFNNLSLQEIADNYKISKNAVSKSIKEAKEKLNYYEQNMKLFQNKEKIKKILSPEDFERIEKYI